MSFQTKQVTGGERSSPRATDSSDITAAMNVQLSTGPRHPGSQTLRLAGVKTPVVAPPSSIPGLRSLHNFNNVSTTTTATTLALSESDQKNAVLSQSQQSTPSSDESNSPTELNSYKRLADKPPLIKRLAMGLSGGNGAVLGGGDDSCPLVLSSGSPTTPSNRPLSGGYVNEAITETDTSRNSAKQSSDDGLLDNNHEVQTKHIEIDNNRQAKICGNTLKYT